ncbi:MAG: YdcF family protein [Leptospiraceae bacterium]|nr:YdcF family protein [Leptospiraceae bacterium]MCP5499059.1 YdcF family protein [Leptospiraceae bacterium]
MKTLLYSSVIILFCLLLTSLVIDLSFEIHYLLIESSQKAEAMQPKTVAIVPGAAVYRNKKPSSILRDRLQGALSLYQNNKVKKILLSGDNSSRSYNEIRPMLNFMIKNRVRKEDIFVDFAGFRTLDTLTRARKVYEIEDAIIVTQRFHQPRAAYIARKLGMEVSCLESDSGVYRDKKKNRLREFFARNLAWLDMNIIHTPPRFLGAKYPISGSGNQTWSFK